MSVAYLNENQYRDFPFVEKSRPLASGIDIPKSWIVDCGITLCDAPDVTITQWYLRRVVRFGNIITIVFASELGAAGVDNMRPEIKFKYNLAAAAEFSTYTSYLSHVGSALLDNGLVLRGPQVQVMDGVSTSGILAERSEYYRTSAYIVIGDPVAIASLLPNDGRLDFTPTVYLPAVINYAVAIQPQAWFLEPCQITNLQTINFKSFSTHWHVNSNNAAPIDWPGPLTNAGDYGSTTAIPAKVPAYYLKNGPPEDASASYKAASRPNMENFGIPEWLPGSNYNRDQRRGLSPFSGPYYRALVSHTAGVFATDLAAGRWQQITPAFQESGRSGRYLVGDTNMMITVSQESKKIVMSGLTRKEKGPGNSVLGAAIPGPLFDQLDLNIAVQRIANGQTPTVQPGISCNNLIYMLNGLQGPDVKVNVGPGLVLSSTGDGHLKISLDATNQKIQDALGLT